MTVLEQLQIKLTADLNQQLDNQIVDPWSQPEWVPTPKQMEIVRILRDEPILTGATLEFLKQKQAQIAQCKLNALYTPEQLAEFQQQMGL